MLDMQPDGFVVAVRACRGDLRGRLSCCCAISDERQLLHFNGFFVLDEFGKVSRSSPCAWFPAHRGALASSHTQACHFSPDRVKARPDGRHHDGVSRCIHGSPVQCMGRCIDMVEHVVKIECKDVEEYEKITKLLRKNREALDAVFSMELGHKSPAGDGEIVADALHTHLCLTRRAIRQVARGTKD